MLTQGTRREMSLLQWHILPNKEDLMDIYEALYTTRAMRRLKPDHIPYDVQARILDAAIRAPHIGEGWRFILVDDPQIKSQLAPLYRQGMERMVGAPLETLEDMMKGGRATARTTRSVVHLAEPLARVPGSPSA